MLSLKYISKDLTDAGLVVLAKNMNLSFILTKHFLSRVLPNRLYKTVRLLEKSMEEFAFGKREALT